MMARGDDAERVGLGVAEILSAAKEPKLAHGHRYIGLFGEAGEDAANDSVFVGAIDSDPAGGFERRLHPVLRSDQNEIDAITGSIVRVTHATWNRIDQ